MRILKSLFILAFVLTSIASAVASIPENQNVDQASRYIDGTVARVVDGDTIKFSSGAANKKPLSIRLVGIDTPEQHFMDQNGNWANQGRWGDQASEYLAAMIPAGTSITLLDLDSDKYGRVLGILFKDKQDLNLEMVRSGWAIPYFICSGSRCDQSFFQDSSVDSYLRACEVARNQGKGVFNPRDPLKEMPFEFRTRLGGRKFERFVGDYQTKKLYRPNDYKKVDVCNRVFFDRADVAESLGFYFENVK